MGKQSQVKSVERHGAVRVFDYQGRGRGDGTALKNVAIDTCSFFGQLECTALELMRFSPCVSRSVWRKRAFQVVAVSLERAVGNPRSELPIRWGEDRENITYNITADWTDDFGHYALKGLIGKKHNNKKERGKTSEHENRQQSICCDIGCTSCPPRREKEREASCPRLKLIIFGADCVLRYCATVIAF